MLASRGDLDKDCMVTQKANGVRGVLICTVAFTFGVLVAIAAASSAAENGRIESYAARQAASDHIRDLISAYAYTYDSKDMDAFLNLFTEDANWKWVGPTGKTALKFDSRQELRKFVVPRTHAHKQQGIISRHYQTNTVFTEVGAKKARARTYVLVTWQYLSQAAPRPKHSGYYEDTFVKTQAGWKFSKRVAHLDHKPVTTRPSQSH